jgi:hypothetical protein
MALDLAKEVGSLLEQMQALIGRAVAESKGKGLSGPALRLNALHHELKGLHQSLKAGEHGAAAGAPADASPQTAPAADTVRPATSHQEAWGNAFHDLPASTAPTGPAQAPRPGKGKRKKDTVSAEEDKDIWEGLSDP